VSDDGLQEENEWLKERLSHLEEYIRKLEYENFKLKSTIGDAIMSLKTQNAETKEMIYGTNAKGIVTTGENFKSYIKKDEES
jgi:sugar-specific transcriptional regulator TrmB